MTFSTNKSSRTVLVDPRFAIEWRDIEDFLGEFGPFNGRYVPRYPSNWTDQIRKYIEDLSLDSLGPVKKQAAIERIRRELPLCSTPVGWGYDDSLSWPANVNKILDQIRDFVIVGDALEPEPFLSWVDAIQDIRQNRKRSWPFHGTISEYLYFCRPLLLNSPAAYLVDCYLDPFSNVAENFIRSLFSSSKGSRCYSIEIITRRTSIGSAGTRPESKQRGETNIEFEFKRIYQDIVPKDKNLKIHIVSEDKVGSDTLRLHDRFFLTKYGSISFGQGFLFVDQKSPQQNAFVTDSGHHKLLKQTYIDGVARYHEKLPKISGIPYPLNVESICI